MTTYLDPTRFDGHPGYGDGEYVIAVTDEGVTVDSECCGDMITDTVKIRRLRDALTSLLAARGAPPDAGWVKVRDLTPAEKAEMDAITDRLAARLSGPLQRPEGKS